MAARPGPRRVAARDRREPRVALEKAKGSVQLRNATAATHRASRPSPTREIYCGAAQPLRNSRTVFTNTSCCSYIGMCPASFIVTAREFLMRLVEALG